MQRVRKSKGGNAAGGDAPAEAEVHDGVEAGGGFYERTNPHKPSYRAQSSHRSWTLSVAIPGSVIWNAQTPELQTRLAGNIARSCAIFNVDEVVIFNDGEEAPRANSSFDPHTFLARLLQYLETPQYLRKALFPLHRDLRLAGLMAPLDCPHHLRVEDESEYREGVVLADGRVDVGLYQPVRATPSAQEGARVTVHMREPYRLVSPRDPVTKAGMYWGYSVRLASSLGAALTESPYGEYDLVIGTSERGEALTNKQLPAFNHALLVLGGLSGLEVAVERDEGIKLTADDAHELFDAWINVVENQGSRTVRTEVSSSKASKQASKQASKHASWKGDADNSVQEALMIALARLKTPLETLGK